MSRILYPTVEEIIETNRRVLEIVVDKRDRHVVWNEDAIAKAIATPSREKEQRFWQESGSVILKGPKSKLG